MDYTQMKPTKEFKAGAQSNQSPRASESGYWWKADDEKELAKYVVATGLQLEKGSVQRHQANLIHARLYGNFDIVGFGARDYARAMIASTYPGSLPARISFNVVASCCDTLASKVGKNKPRPLFLTDGQAWKQQQKAKNLTKFTNGLFYETKVFEKAKPVRMDAYIFGTGFMHVYKDPFTKRIVAERAFMDEMFVDDADGVYGEPRQLFRRRLVDRAVLLERFGVTDEKIHRAIMEAKSRSEDTPLRGMGDMVTVWEAWHLPSAPGAKDGLHVIAVDGCVLFQEEWKHDFFPFAVRRYRKRVLGYWGQGIAESLTGIQVEMNRTIRSISEQIRRKGKGRIMAPINSVDPAQLDNSIAPIIFFKGGVPPTVDNSSAVSADEFQHLDRLYQRAFQEVGLSELSAASKKPSGLDAAVALREFSDIESDRFALDGQADEQFFMDFTEIALALIADDGGKGYKVKLPNKRNVIEIDWKDINLPRDAYTMQMFPVSSLPSTPAARLQRVNELRDGGYIDMPTARALLDYPDIENEMDLANAAQEDADACVSMILDDETPTMPGLEPYQDLSVVITRANAAYLYARHHGCDEERLEMLRQFIDKATKSKADLMAAPVGPPGGGAPPPAGPPGPMGPPGPLPGPAPVAPPVVAQPPA